MILKSYNPANNTLLGQVQSTSLSEIKLIVNNSRLAFNHWSNSSLEKRLTFVSKLYTVIQSKKEELAKLLTTEMGIPISQSLLDIDSGLEYINWYIENAKIIIGEKVTYEDMKEIDKVIFEPKGVVAVIISWNFPFSSFVWQAISNLIVGNTVILKHSEYVPLCSQYIYNVMSKIFPKNVYSVIYGDGKVGKNLAMQNIDMICFTGSTKTGQNLYKIASKKFIPIILECGGSAPGIILNDANIDSVIDSIYMNKFANTGQICDGQKRLIVHESKFNEVCKKLTNYINTKKIGNPLDETTEIGPIVSKKQLKKLENQVKDAVKKGASIILGGSKLNLGNGNYYLPTILTNITENMKVYNEEVFGPVIPIIKFTNINEAIKIANNTQYGLGGYIYTSDKSKYNSIVKKLNTGMITLNNLYYLKPCNPFGGYKKSGLGKNNSEFGLRELCNIKVIVYEK